MAMAVNHQIRTIEARDNATVEYIIRYCLTEFGANHEGTAWADPDLGRFYELYQGEGRRYWVAENETGQVVAGVGIGPLPGMWSSSMVFPPHSAFHCVG